MNISFNQFKELDLRIAKILEASRVEGSEKLVKLLIDMGGEKRELVAGIGKAYDPDVLVGREIAVVANLESKIFTLRLSSGQVALESQGMLLAAHGAQGEPVLLVPEREVPPGSTIT